jgi:hypothetical protein
MGVRFPPAALLNFNNMDAPMSYFMRKVLSDKKNLKNFWKSLRQEQEEETEEEKETNEEDLKNEKKFYNF